MIDTEAIRNKVLSLALQGKLTKQNSADGAADDFLNKIKSAPSNATTISKDDEPFIIPDTWKWKRFNQVVDFHLGKTPARGTKKYWSNGVYSWITISDMNAPIVSTSKEKISQEAVDDCFTSEISKSGTLIMSFKLSIGKVAILGTDAYHNEAIISIFPRYDKDNIFRDYLKVVLPIAANNGDIHGAIKGNTLNKKSLSDLMIPIPPFVEQLRIVDRMNELRNVFDTIDDLQSNYAADRDVLKGKLIDAAICGKLTKQLPEDGTAEELYKQIQEEKKQILVERKGRTDKKIKKIDTDVPFNIPSQWKWIRFGDVGLFKKGPFGSALTKSMFVPKSDNTIKVYEQQHAIKKNCNLGTYYIKREYFDSDMSGFEVLPGDIIVSCAGTIGETYIMPDDIEKGIINQALMRVTLADGIDKRFFQYYFDANLKKNAQAESNGSAIKNIPPFDVMKNWYFPLPSLREQQRIAETLDNLLANLT